MVYGSGCGLLSPFLFPRHAVIEVFRGGCKVRVVKVIDGWNVSKKGIVFIGGGEGVSVRVGMGEEGGRFGRGVL